MNKVDMYIHVQIKKETEYYLLKQMTRLAIAVYACMTVARYKAEGEACLNSWVKQAEVLDVPVLLYVGSASIPTLGQEDHFVVMPNTADDYQSATDKSWFGLMDIHRRYNPDFVFLCGSDTFPIVKKLVKMLDQYDPLQSLYIGGHGWTRIVRPANTQSFYFHSGGAGFLLTLPLVNQMVPWYPKIIPEWINICKQHAHMHDLPGACDVALAWLVQTKMSNVHVVCREWSSEFSACDIFGQYCCYPNKDFNKLITCHLMTPQLMSDMNSIEQDKSVLIDLKYTVHCKTKSDINEHVQTMYNYAKLSNSILELKRNHSISTWVFLKGLKDRTETPNTSTNFIVVDTVLPMESDTLKEVAPLIHCDLKFIQLAEHLKQPIPEVYNSRFDLLFIDTWHVYGQLKR